MRSVRTTRIRPLMLPRGHSIGIDEVGAWAVAPLAGEWIHYAALAVKAQIPLEVLSDTVAQFPTYTEIYEKAIAKLEL